MEKNLNPVVALWIGAISGALVAKALDLSVTVALTQVACSYAEPSWWCFTRTVLWVVFVFNYTGILALGIITAVSKRLGLL